MIPISEFLSYFNCRQASIRTLILSMGLLLVLFSSFVTPRVQDQQHVKAGWLLPSTTGMERLAEFRDASGPNSDLHLSIRKQTKVKCVKKLQPGSEAAEKAIETVHISTSPIAGFDTVKRPAYYVFLFRYTLF